MSYNQFIISVVKYTDNELVIRHMFPYNQFIISATTMCLMSRTNFDRVSLSVNV